MDMGKRPSFLGDQVVVPTKQSRPLPIDAEQLEHEAWVGRWTMRIIPVGCAAYIAYALWTRSPW